MVDELDQAGQHDGLNLDLVISFHEVYDEDEGLQVELYCVGDEDGEPPTNSPEPRRSNSRSSWTHRVP